MITFTRLTQSFRLGRVTKLFLVRLITTFTKLVELEVKMLMKFKALVKTNSGLTDGYARFKIEISDSNLL